MGQSKESLEAQVAMVKEFADRNSLKMNVGKCEAVMFSRGCSVDVPECVVDVQFCQPGILETVWGFGERGIYWHPDQLMRTLRKRGEPFFTMAA